MDSDACPFEWVGDAVADFLDTNEPFIVEKFCSMVDIDSALILHVEFFEHLIDAIFKVLVVLELVVDLPDGLITPVAE